MLTDAEKTRLTDRMPEYLPSGKIKPPIVIPVEVMSEKNGRVSRLQPETR